LEALTQLLQGRSLQGGLWLPELLEGLCRLGGALRSCPQTQRTLRVRVGAANGRAALDSGFFRALYGTGQPGPNRTTSGSWPKTATKAAHRGVRQGEPPGPKREDNRSGRGPSSTRSPLSPFRSVGLRRTVQGLGQEIAIDSRVRRGGSEGRLHPGRREAAVYLPVFVPVRPDLVLVRQARGAGCRGARGIG
jgi:hypothetical protein